VFKNHKEVSCKEAWLDMGALPEDPKMDPRVFNNHKYRAFDKY